MRRLRLDAMVVLEISVRRPLESVGDVTGPRSAFARQPCDRIPHSSGLRPVALRPTLSDGLPLFGCESSFSLTRPLNTLPTSRSGKLCATGSRV